jgi:hypothetical protein
MKSKTLAVLAAVCAALAAAPAAHANHLAPNLGIQVVSIDPATRTVVAIQHCTSPDLAGRQATFTVTPDIEFSQFAVGAVWGVTVAEGNVILSTGDMPCDAPIGHPGPGGGSGFGPGRPGGPQGGPGGPQGSAGDHDDTPEFLPAFLNRVWKFRVDVDDYAGGKLRVTIDGVQNLPRRFRTQDDEIVDQDAIVLVARNVRIYDADGHRAGIGDLDDADGSARISGKLARPDHWESDEDGQPVPTIRARKIYL